MKLSNDILTIEVAEHGAELVSLKKGGREYLWNGAPAYWNRHAPILFPAVGKPFNNELHADGKVYPMKQHGFARDSEFECVNAGMCECGSVGTMRLIQSSNDAIRQYPYRLGLEVCYLLQGSSVEVVWTVENLDCRDAYFQIGAHPGFMLPDYRGEDALHGFIRYYDHEGKPASPVIVSALEEGNRVPLAEPRRIPAEMPIEADTFAHDALMFEGGQVTKAVLCDKDGLEVLGVDCPQAEAYGIWAPHKEGCPFVCLEPWCGICDAKGFTEDISERQYIHHLAPKEKYTFTYTIEVYR
jgi:galactose mutarotase-like enzyme